jgi:hypothetical protein
VGVPMRINLQSLQTSHSWPIAMPPSARQKGQRYVRSLYSVAIPWVHCAATCPAWPHLLHMDPPRQREQRQRPADRQMRAHWSMRARIAPCRAWYTPAKIAPHDAAIQKRTGLPYRDRARIRLVQYCTVLTSVAVRGAFAEEKNWAKSSARQVMTVASVPKA